MNKITKLFQEKKNILSVYFTAGFPKLNDTNLIITELENAGVDLIEVGMPFSDPLADGPTIQRSSEHALENGMSIKLLFDQLKELKGRTTVPLILMGYLNPVIQYGVERFCEDAAGIGILGIILPDLPVQEYLDKYRSVFEKYDIKNIFLITPQTSEARIRMIDEHSSGFIYVVSSASTTGGNDSIRTEQKEYFNRIKGMNLKNPIVIGFGIHDHSSFMNACEYANGGIIGSAFIKALGEGKDLKKDIPDFVDGIRNGALIKTI
jgi:tryptophan synthase alpha chain